MSITRETLRKTYKKSNAIPLISTPPTSIPLTDKPAATSISELNNAINYIFYGNVPYKKLIPQALTTAFISGISCYVIDKFIFEYTQKAPKNIFDASKAVWGKLRSGFGYSLLSTLSRQTATFTFRCWTENFLNTINPQRKSENRLISNFAGGMLGVFATFPLAVVKMRRFNQDYQKLSLSMLYKGVGTTAVRDTLHWGILFGMQDAMKAFFHYAKEHPEAPANILPLHYVNNTLGFGIISGSITSFLTNSVANIANWQRTVGLSAKDAYRAILKQSGFKGLFFNGLSFCTLRIVTQATVVKGVSNYLDPTVSHKSKPGC